MWVNTIISLGTPHQRPLLIQFRSGQVSQTVIANLIQGLRCRNAGGEMRTDTGIFPEGLSASLLSDSLSDMCGARQVSPGCLMASVGLSTFSDSLVVPESPADVLGTDVEPVEKPSP